MEVLRAQLELLLNSVTKPGRYLGGEWGSVHKDPRSTAVRFALAFPEVYEIAQSHYGLQVLYDILNRRPDTWAERVYAPWPDMEAALRDARLPLASIESLTPLRDFDIVGFSLQYELTYTNILMMLDLGGIPLRAGDRSSGDPLVIAGGPCAFNPEPVADFFDAILLGDGEQAVEDICDAYLSWDGADRSALLAALAGIRGVYVPSIFEPRYDGDGRFIGVHALRGPAVVEKRVLADLDTVPIQRTYVVPTVQIVHDRPSLEVMRGCVKGCRFCQAGYIYRPLRERHPHRVLAHAEEAVRKTGCEELSLLSLSTGDYSCINPVLTEIMNRFAARKVAVSLPSMRVDALGGSLIEQIKRVRKTGFTLAPEAGTQRMRDLIQKEYTEQELLEAARQVFALGWRNLKLYFMLGLPTETDEDLLGIAEISAKVAAAGNFRRQVTASVSTFIPKAHTPLQWAPQISLEETLGRQQFLKHELARRGVKFKWHDARESFLEGVFSRGDRRLGPAVLAAYELGCRFDGWSEALRFDLWQEAWERSGIDPARYLRRRDLDAPLPWDHLGSGVDKRFLQKELTHALARTLTPDCAVERCTQCGACDFKSIRNVTYHLRGAKGAEHRGAAIDGWARQIVPGDADGAWEPRQWRLRQAAPAARAAASDRAVIPADSCAAFEDQTATVAASRTVTANGNGAGHGAGSAEAWLHAGSSALMPGDDAAVPCMRLRLRYAKRGPARLVGHLELGTVFFRAARRAELPVAFSRGHHPLPRFAFGPALPVGIESDNEYLDIDLTQSRPPDSIREALNRELPSGFEALEAAAVPLNVESIDSQVVAFRYLVDASAGGGTAPLAEPLAAFMKATDFPLRKHRRGGDRSVNARLFVSRLAAAGPATIEAVILFGRQGTLKPADLIAAVLGLAPPEAARLKIRKVETIFRQPTLQAGQELAAL